MQARRRVRSGCSKLVGVGQPEGGLGGGAGGWSGGIVLGEARVVQAGVAGETQTPRGKASANESYEGGQMLWKDMAGRNWAELVQQWGVTVVEPPSCKSRLQP